ncbi:MAG: autotransporter-associated beta strand repeat-containing protein, partial [Planctomycetaceae bacterium]|nr:autotransporter-associated beta strand repeat-containing protein [Planctomycetaceae bacterium]
STFNLNGFNQQVAAVSTMAGATVTGAGSTLTLGGAANTLTATGVNRIETGLVLTTSAAATRTIALTGANDILTISGDIGDGGPTAAGAITTSGLGTLVLTGVNTYRGNTTIATGNTLIIGNNSALGTGTLSLTGGAQLIPNYAGVNLPNAVTTAAGFTLGGTTDVTFGNTLTLTGASTITLNNPGTTTFNAITATNQSLTLTGMGNVVLNSPVTIGTGSLTKANIGTLTFSGNNMLPTGGGFLLSSGTIDFGNSTQTVNSFSVGRSGITTLSLNGTAVLNITGNSSGGLFLGDSGVSASGTLNVAAGSSVFVGGSNGVVFANGAGGAFINESGTLNLSGLLVTRKISMVSAAGSSGTLNIDGGVIRAGGSNNSFLSGLSSTVIQSGGATFDANGFAVNIRQPLAGSGALTIVDTAAGQTGVVTLSGANVYTGPTNVTTGNLGLAGGGSLGGTAITIGAGRSLNVAGDYTIGTFGSPTLTLGSGATLSLVDSAIGALTLNSATPLATILSMGTGTGTFLNFDIGGTTDQINLSAGAAFIGGGGVTLNPTLAGALANGTYTLISAPGGGLLNTNGSTGGFTLAANVVGGASLAFNLTDTLLSITVSNAPAPPPTAFFRGNAPNWNSFTGGSLNWATDATGTTPTDALPGPVTDVRFYVTGADPANLATTLGQDFSIRTLSYDVGTAPVAVDGAISGSSNRNTLTITPVDSTTGITLGAGAGMLSISAPIIVGADQTWANNSTSLLNVSGGTTGGGNVTIKANTAAVNIISAPLNHSGTIVNAGGAFTTTISGGVGANVRSISNSGGSTLTISGAPLTVNNNGTSLVNNATTTFTVSGGINGAGNLTIRANSTGAFTIGTAGVNNTGTITNSGVGTATTTISGVIGSNVAGVVQNSPTSALSISSTGNSFSSPLTIRAGTVFATMTTTALVNALGTGTLVLGHTSGSNNATFLSSQTTASPTYANNILLQTGTTGTLTIGNNTSVTTGVSTFSGTISGNNNLTITNNSTGNVVLSNSSINPTGTITNAGTGTGPATISGIIGGSVTGVIQNSGTSRVTLSGANTYTSPTTVNAGVLTLAGAGSLAGTAITVNPGATLAVQPTTNFVVGTSGGSPSITIAGGGILSMLDTTTKILTINSASPGSTVLTLGDTAAAILNMEINSGNAINDTITLGAGLKARVNAGGVVVNPSLLGQLTTGNAYTLITAPGGGLLSTNGSSGFFNFGNGSNVITIAGSTLMLTQTDTALTLNVSSVAPAAADLYFRGGVDGAWNTFSAGNTNWTTDQAGTINAQSIPGAATNVHFFAAGGTNLATSLQQNFTINSLAMDNGTTAVSISGAAAGGTSVNTLTITPNDPALGINSSAGAGTLTITANVALGASQTWTNNSANAVNVSGIVSGAGPLAVAGTGTVAFSVATNTNSGGLTIRGGTVTGTVAQSFGATSNALVLGDAAGNAAATISSSGIATHAFASITINAGTTGTLKIQSTATATGAGSTFGGPIALNNNLTVDGTVAAKAVIFSGTMTQLAGTPLTITKTGGAGSATFNGATVVGGGGLTLSSVGGTSATALLSLNGNISGTGNLILSNSTAINGGIVLAGGSINNNGSITNSGPGTGTSLITGTVGTSVGALIQNSATSGLTLSTGGVVGTSVNVLLGTLTTQGNYTIGTTGSPTLNVSSGGILSLIDGVANTLTINSATVGATVLNLAAGSTLNLEVGAAADRIDLGLGLAASLAGTVTINPVLYGPLSTQDFTLISAPGGGLTSGGFVLSNSSLGGASLGLTITDDAVVLNVFNPNTPTAAYFRGNIDSRWNGFSGAALNWTSDAAGSSPTTAIPGSTTDVHFYAGNVVAANLNTTLGQNFTIKTLTFDGGSATQAVSIAGTVPNSGTLNTLTLAPALPTTGITVNSGAGAVTITAPIILGADQTWTTNSSNTFSIATNALNNNTVDLNGFNLTVTAGGTGAVTFSQDIVGTGDLTFNANGTAAISVVLNGTQIQNVGSIFNGGTGAGSVTLFNISGNAASIVQNSNTSQLLFGTGTGSGFTPSVNGTSLISNGAALMSVANGISASSGAVSVITNSSGTIVIPGNLAQTGNLLLSANGPGAISIGGNVSAAPMIINSGSGQGSAVISGNITGATTAVVQNSPTSTLSLNGANTYAGATAISAGTLALTGGSLAGTGVTAATGARLLIQNNPLVGSAGSPSVTIAGGATLSMVGGAANKLTINSAAPGATVLTLGGVNTASRLDLEIGDSADQILLGAGLKALINAGGVNLNITSFGAIAAGDWTLIDAPGGGLFDANNTISLFNLLPSNVGATLSLANSTNFKLILSVSPFTTPATAYFRGNVGTSWAAFSGTDSNWTTDAAGLTNTHALPGAQTDVHFYASGAANLNTTLTQNFKIQSLTVDGVDPGNVGIGSGGGILTIDPSASTTDPNTGILVKPGSGTLAISAPIVLGATQTWTNNSSSLVSITGGVNGTAALTLNGTGTGGLSLSSSIDGDVTNVTVDMPNAVVTFSGVNTFTGTLTVASGTLAANSSAQALSFGGAVLNLAGGNLDFNSNSALAFGRNTTIAADAVITAEKNVAGAGVTYTLGTLAVAGQTLTVNGGNVVSGTTGVTFGAATLAGNPTFAVNNPVGGGTTLLTLGALNDGGTARTITKSGTGALTVATAAVSVSPGTLLNVTGGTFNSNLATALGANVSVAVGDGATFAVSVSQAIGSLNDISLVNPTGIVSIGGTTQTLTIGSVTSNLDSSFGGVITGTAGSAIAKQGSGTLTLSGVNTYLGATGVLAGTLRLGASNVLPAASALTIGNANNAATLDLNGFTQSFNAATAIVLGGAAGGVSTQATINLGTTGLLNLGGNLTFTATGNPTATQQINGGTIDLGTATRTFNVGNSTGAAIDLAISSVIQGSGGITKSGAGNLLLSGVNTFTGNFAFTSGQPGAVIITNSSALGVGPKTVTIADTTAGNSNSLQLDGGGGNITLAANLSFVTSSANGTGGIVNLAGDNVINGNITLQTGANTQITVGGGSLTLAGTTITTNTTGRSLLLNGTGDGRVNAAIVDGGGSNFLGLQKLGTGNWALTAANTFSAGTQVQQGTLRLAGGNNRLLSTAGGAANVVLLGNGANSGKLILGGDAVGGTGVGTRVMQTLTQNAAASILAVSGTGTANAVVGGADNGGDVLNNSILTLNIGTGFTDTYAGLIGGAGLYENNINLVKSGGGVLVLAGDLSLWTGTGAGPTDPTRPTITVGGGVLRLTSTAVINTAIFNTGGLIDDQGFTRGPNFSLTTTGGLITLNSATDTFASYGITAASHGVVALNFNNNAVVDYADSDMYLGAVGARVYSAASLTPTVGQPYRFGGGGPWQALGAATIGGFGGYLQIATPNLVTGANDVVIGDNGSYNSGGGLFGSNSVVEFTAPQNFDGKLILAGGSFVVANVDRLGSKSPAAGSVVLDGGIFRYSGMTTDVSGRLTIAGGGTVDTNGQNVTFAVGIGNSNAGTSGLASGGLTKIGAGALTLAAVNTYAGPTTIAQGALTLNMNTAAASNVVDVASSLRTMGGALNVVGTGGTTARSQTFAGTSFDSGSVTFTPTLQAASTTANVLTVDFGALARAVGATGNIVFTTGNTTTTNTQLLTSTGTAGGLITDANGAAYLTFGTSATAVADWAVKDATNTKIVQPSAGFYTAATATTVANNADIGALSPTVTGVVGDNPITSIRFNNAGVRTLTLNTAGALFSVGGILVGSAVGNNLTTIAGTGTLRGPNAGVGDLIIHNWDVSSSLTISMAVGGTGGLTKAGTGSLVLTGTNTYSGQTVINAGTLTMDAVARYGSTSGFTLNGGTFVWSATAAIPKTFTLGLNGGTLNITGAGNQAIGVAGDALQMLGLGARTLTLNGIADRRQDILFSIGDGGGPTSLVLNAAGDNSVLRLSGSNSYTGTTTISRGVLDLNSATALPGGLGGTTLSLANTGGNNLIFNGGSAAVRAILQLSTLSGDFYRSLGTGFDQVQFLGNGGWANTNGVTTRIVNLGGAGAPVTWGLGGFVPTGSLLQFGVSGTNVPAAGAIDFQNAIVLGGTARSIDVANNTQTANTSGVDAVLSGNLTGTTGGGLTKIGAGVLKLTGDNTTGTAADFAVNVNAGVLLFEDLAAIPGAAPNRNVATTAGGVALQGATNLAPLLDRIALSSAGFVLLDTSSSTDVDLSAFASLGLGAYADIGGVPVYFTGRITPNGAAGYRLASQSLAAPGGVGVAGAAIQTANNYLVLTRQNTLTGANALTAGSGALLITNSNDFSGGTTLQSTLNGGVGAAQLGFGNDAALGTGSIGVANATSFIGSLNGDHALGNNVRLNASGNFVVSANLASDGIVNAGALSWLGTLTINAAGNTLFARAGNNALFYGDIAPASGTPTLGVSSGTVVLLTQPTGAVPKSFNALNFVAATTVVIDGDRSLGAVPASAATNISYTTAGTLQVQPGSPDFSLSANRNLAVTSGINWTIVVPGGPVTGSTTLTVPGVVSGGGGTSAPVKNGLGTLRLQGTNTVAATAAAGFIVNAGALELDYANLQGSGPILNGMALTLGNSTAGSLSGGGTLRVTVGGAAAAQSFTNLATTSKDNFITVNSSGGALTLGLGATITRVAGGTLNFAGTGLAAATISSTFAAVNGIVPGATWNGRDLVAADGAALSAYAGYTGLLGGTIVSSAGSNVRIDNTTSVNVSLAATGTTDINTLTFADTLARTVDVRNLTTAGTLRFGVVGMILAGASSGALTVGVAGTAGTITAGATTNGAGELILANYSANPLQVNSVIAINGTGVVTVVKSGPGLVTLAGNNTYTGSLFVNNGVLAYGRSAASQDLGNPTAAATNIIMNGGTLRYTGTASSNLIYGVTFNTVSSYDVFNAAGTVNQTAQGLIGIAGVPGILQKIGPGTLTTSGTTNNANLSVQVRNGVFNLGKTSSSTVHAVEQAVGAALIVESGATAAITGTGGDQILDTGSIVVRGTFDLGGQSEAVDGLAGDGVVTSATAAVLTLGGAAVSNNLANISANTPAAAAAGVAASGLNKYVGTLSGALSLVKNGAGTQYLGGVASYTGSTTINAGVLMLTAVNALPSGVGKGDLTIEGGTNVNGLVVPGVLDLGGFDQSLNGLNSATGGVVTNTVPLAFLAGNWTATPAVKTLTVGLNDASGSFSGVLQDGLTIIPTPGTGSAASALGTLALTKTGAGTQTLRGANTYTGPTKVLGGTLSIATGGSLTSTDVTVAAGATYAGHALFGLATGTALTADGTVNLQNAAQSLAALNGTTSAAVVALQGTTLTVAGGGSYAGAITDGGGVGALTVAGSTLTLTGTSTYTGATTVASGTLRLSGGALGATNVAVAGGAVLAGSGQIGTTAGGGVTIAGGASPASQGSLNLVDGAVATLTLRSTAASSALILGGTAGNAAALHFEIAAPGSSDKIVIADGAGVTANLGGATIDITGLAGVGLGTYDLVTFSAGQASGFANLALGVVPTTAGLRFKLNETTTAWQLNVTQALSYWSGAVDGSWSTVSGVGNATNWLDGPAGSDTHLVPTPSDDVVFTAATAANLATTLDAAFTINGLTFTGSGTPAASTSVSIASGVGGHSLTINGNGITVQTGSASHSIAAPIVLGADQTWTNNVANVVQHVDTGLNGVLRVSGVQAAGKNLTFAGPGNFAVTGNFLAGGNVVKNGGGTLVLAGDVDANIAVNAGTLAAGGHLIGAANNFSVGANGTFSPGAVAASASAGIGTFTNDSTGPVNEWNPGSHLIFQFNAVPALGSPGTNWDLIQNFRTPLTIKATAADKMTIVLESFASGSLTTIGSATGFDNSGTDPGVSYSWLFATNVLLDGSDSIESRINLDQSGVWNSATYAGGYGTFAQPLDSGRFFVSYSSGSVFINYSAVPEPGSLLLLGIAACGFAAYRRGAKSASQRQQE